MVNAAGRTAVGVAHEPATGAPAAEFVPDPAFVPDGAVVAASEDADADADAPVVSWFVALDALAVDEPVEPGTTAGVPEVGAVLVAVEVGDAAALVEVDDVEEDDELDDEDVGLDAGVEDAAAVVVAIVVFMVLCAVPEQPATRAKGKATIAIRFMGLILTVGMTSDVVWVVCETSRIP